MNNDKEELLELYKIMIDSINSNESKRLQTNIMYTTIISALIAIISSGLVGLNLSLISTVILFLSISWYVHIFTYRKLAQAKFEVINELEKNFLVPIYAKEWNYYKKISPKIEQTLIEMGIPIVIGTLSVCYIVYRIFLYFYKVL